MKVKLRPTAHFAPVTRGVYCAMGARSFVLAGPRGLYEALDAQIEALIEGTELDELVENSGGEGSRPVWQYVLSTLVEHGVLLDLGTLSVEAPPAAEADRYRDVLSWLESTHDDPYAAYARLRAARVTVTGSGPAEATLRRSLLRHAIGSVEAAEADAAAPAGTAGRVIAVDIDGCGARGSIAIRTAGEYALVGPSGAALDALESRVAATVGADPALVAAFPVSAALAGSLAADRVLRELAGDHDGAREAIVLHGREVETDIVRLPAFDAENSLERVLLKDTSEPEQLPDAAESQRMVNLIAGRWTGVLAWGTDLDLPQLPFALVTAAATRLDAPIVTGFGLNRAAAAVNAALSVLRAEHGAAGISPTRWLLDGVLRRAAGLAMGRDADAEVSWDAISNADTRSVWNLLHEYFDRPVEVQVRRLDRFTWVLVTVTDSRTGETLAGQWGASVEHGARLALIAAASAVQLEMATGSMSGLDLIGTTALETTSGRAVRVAAAEADALDFGPVVGDRVSWDPVLGEVELCWGPTWTA